MRMNQHTTSLADNDGAQRAELGSTAGKVISLGADADSIISSAIHILEIVGITTEHIGFTSKIEHIVCYDTFYGTWDDADKLNTTLSLACLYVIQATETVIEAQIPGDVHNADEATKVFNDLRKSLMDHFPNKNPRVNAEPSDYDSLGELV